MGEWDIKKTLALIEDLHNTPCLWDMQCFDYKNGAKKNEEYERIAAVYGVSASKVERKIKCLKTQFRREHKKVLKSEASGGFQEIVKWFGYKGLLFLLQQYESNRKRSAIADRKAREETSTLKEEYEDEDVIPVDEVSTSSSGMTTTARRELAYQPLQNKSNVPYAHEQLKSTKLLNGTVSERDEYTVYGEHIANKLRHSGRSHVEIAIAQHQIDDICFNLTMGAFNEQSRR